MALSKQGLTYSIFIRLGERCTAVPLQVHVKNKTKLEVLGGVKTRLKVSILAKLGERCTSVPLQVKKVTGQGLRYTAVPGGVQGINIAKYEVYGSAKVTKGVTKGS